MDYKLVHKCYEESRMRFYDSKYDHYVNLLDLDPRKDFEDVNVCIHDSFKLNNSYAKLSVISFIMKFYDPS